MTRHRRADRGLPRRQGIERLTQVTRSKENIQEDPEKIIVWANLNNGPELVEFQEFSSGGVKVRKDGKTFFVFLSDDVGNVDDLKPRQAIMFKGTQPGRRLRFYSVPRVAPISDGCVSVDTWFTANHICDEIHLQSDESTEAAFGDQVYFWNNLGNAETVQFINDGRATDSSNYTDVVPPTRNENGLSLGGNNVMWTEQPGLIDTGKRLTKLKVDMTIGLEGVSSNFGAKPVFFYGGDETSHHAGYEIGFYESFTTGDMVFTLGITDDPGTSGGEQIQYDEIDIPVSQRDNIEISVVLNIDHEQATVDATFTVNGTELTSSDSFGNYSFFEFFSENFSDVISLANRSHIDNGTLVNALDYDDNNGENFQMKFIDIDFEQAEFTQPF